MVLWIIDVEVSSYIYCTFQFKFLNIPWIFYFDFQIYITYQKLFQNLFVLFFKICAFQLPFSSMSWISGSSTSSVRISFSKIVEVCKKDTQIIKNLGFVWLRRLCLMYEAFHLKIYTQCCERTKCMYCQE